MFIEVNEPSGAGTNVCAQGFPRPAHRGSQPFPQAAPSAVHSAVDSVVVETAELVIHSTRSNTKPHRGAIPLGRASWNLDSSQEPYLGGGKLL